MSITRTSPAVSSLVLICVLCGYDQCAQAGPVHDWAGKPANPSTVQHVGAGDGVAVSTAAIGEATTTSSSSLCPGPPPPPIECFRVVCLTNDASWDYRPLAAGAACSDGGTCDGAGNCVV